MISGSRCQSGVVSFSAVRRTLLSEGVGSQRKDIVVLWRAEECFESVSLVFSVLNVWCIAAWLNKLGVTSG